VQRRHKSRATLPSARFILPLILLYLVLGGVSIRFLWDMESKKDMRFALSFLQRRRGCGDFFRTRLCSFYLRVVLGILLKLSKGQALDNGIMSSSYFGGTMNKFLKRLNAGEIMVADGATGSNLQMMGIKPGTPPEDLVMDNPEIILNLATSFVEAGSDIILTCTFGGSALRMQESKYADRVPEVNLRAVELAQKAASKETDVLVAGSIGPTGTLMKPFGPMKPEDAFATFAEQAKTLAKGGVDLLVIETMFAFDETDAAFDGARSVTDLPIVVSISYDRGVATMMGVKPKDVIEKYQEKGATLVGANCGTTLENMEKIVNEYAETTPASMLWIKPNAGLPRMDVETGISTYDVTPEEMGEFAKKYIALGARVVGGCCGSTPEHVAGIAKAVKN